MTILNLALNNIQETIVNYIANIAPATLIIGGSALAISIASGYFFSQSPLNDRTEKLVKSCEGKSKTEAAKMIEQFIKANWPNIAGAEDCLNNSKNKTAIYEKLLNIILTKQSTGLKIEIFKNVLKNFKTSNLATVRKIQNDIETDEEFRALFHISKGTRMVKMERLGVETHHRGALPLLITLSNGEKIIYKPRSMVPEKIICGHKDSYFSKLKDLGKDLGIYRVHDKGSYGYCEFLGNKLEENTFECKDDLREYARKFILLDRYASFIGLSDLHNENIITKAKLPYTIDDEVVMMPQKSKFFDTQLLGGVCPGWMIENDTKNKIAWKKENGKLTNFQYEYEFFVEYLVEEQQNLPAINANEEELVTDCKTQLSVHNHRIIIIPTQTLSANLKRNVAEGTKNFMELLEERLAIWGFEMDKTVTSKIQEKFNQDLLNNDVPLFYFNPASGHTFYDDLPIGQLKNEDLLVFEDEKQRLGRVVN